MQDSGGANIPPSGGSSTAPYVDYNLETEVRGRITGQLSPVVARSIVIRIRAGSLNGAAGYGFKEFQFYQILFQ